MSTFKVSILPSDITFTVQAGQTILDAAQQHHIALPYGCKRGRCGTCAVRLLKGTVQYPQGTPALLSSQSQLCLVCQAVPNSDLQIEVKLRDDQDAGIHELTCQILSKTIMTADVVQLSIAPTETTLPPFRAGQYLKFIPKNSHPRPFSFANAPGAETIELHIRRQRHGGFTDYLFEQAQEAEQFQIRMPYGQFTLTPQSQRPLLLLGTSTGVAPLKSLCEDLIQSQQRRETYLYWGMRTAADCYLCQLFEHWQATYAWFHFIPVLSRPVGDSIPGQQTGWVQTVCLANHSAQINQFDIYLSGSPAMVEAGIQLFQQQGVNAQQLWSDAFIVTMP
jgi:CDP-4-dehydro-6-deoxyglucose reductase